ncbi:hypothetical protein Patl1_35095 [Pistacia atlantica]|uniref:Uncharacterized protein n=1 Tax=Pistacia atlantica TaxID=434234 RepID=A0ACC0ZP31_9ROSI|nr:hypothetical protein Patl1_35095 [Pistacia atlantica]
MDSSNSIQTATAPIPVDLFVSKKHPGLTRGEIGFADSSGNIVFKVNRQSSAKIVVLNSIGNPLVSLYHQDKGLWQGFKGDDGGEKDLMFRVQRMLNRLTRTEFDVFLFGENQEESTSDVKMKGFPFRRSCTIFKGNSIVAQVCMINTSLMYKLHQIYARRNRFRLTIFPGSFDTTLIVALVAIFFD